MKGYLAMIALFTVLNTAVNVVIWRDLQERGPIEVQTTENLRAMVNDELNRHRCHTLLYLGKQVKLSEIEQHCWRDHWAVTESENR